MIVSAGIRMLLKGSLYYSNYWGAAVFGPFAIVVGAFLLYILLFRWCKIAQAGEHGKGRAQKNQASG
jgi:hypothetical protein